MVKDKQKILNKLKLLPEHSGIYLWKDFNGDVIYVGKAKNLHNRIRFYLTDHNKDHKTELIVLNACDLEFIITNSENEAYILEANLIKQYKPKYNILLKDDKKYPFIVITTSEPYPRILVTREVNKTKDQYFGPFTDTRSLRKTLKLLEWIFPLRDCKRNIFLDKVIFSRACINYQLSKCPAPCIGKISVDDYHIIVKLVIDFFCGKYQQIINQFTDKMLSASEIENFEEAALWRDRILEIRNITKKQSVYYPDGRNIDVIGFYQEQSIVYVVILKMINGKVSNQESYPLKQIENSNREDILAAFLKLYYTNKDVLPNEIFLPHKPNDFEELNKWLSNKFLLPQRGEKYKLLMMANKNAFHLVEEKKLSHMKKANRTILPIRELKEKLDLPKLPIKIVCIDISTIQGSDTVSSAVFYENGKPKKNYYRHFIIRSINHQNDYAAISETILRFLDETKKDNNLIPDLLIIDGGKGQLNSAHAVLNSYEINISLISIAKRNEEIFTLNGSDSIILAKSSLALRFITEIRDEAHRFAINFHHLRRTKRTLVSELEDIKGIGIKTKFLLLKELGSIQAIKKSKLIDLLQIKGIGTDTAQKIIKHFNSDN